MSLIDVYDGEFDDTIKEASFKYHEKKKKYGESWKEMNIMEIHRRWRGEISEFEDAFSADKMFKELLDVANLSLMFAERLRKYIKRKV